MADTRQDFENILARLHQAQPTDIEEIYELLMQTLEVLSGVPGNEAAIPKPPAGEA